MTVNRCLLALLVAHGLAGGIARAEEPTTPLYRDASQPIDKRIDDLLGRMTLEEKVGQMNMPCVYESALGHTIAEKTEASAEVRGRDVDREVRAGGRLLHPAQHDSPRRPPPASRVSEPAPEAGPGPDAPGDSAPGDGRRHARPDVSRRDDLPGGPRAGEHLEHGSAGPGLCIRRAGSACHRRAPDLHARRRAHPGSSPRAQRGSIQRRPLPLLADRRDHCPLGARQRSFRPRQGRLRALPLSWSKPAGQRPGTRGHGDLGTDLARGLPSSLAGRNQERRIARGHGDLSGD